MTEVLHLTAHLGGGVGKALSSLVEAHRREGMGFRHIIVCLEPLEKDQFATRIRAAGGELVICPNQAELERRVTSADIVQLEWWNHPATIQALYNLTQQPMRLIVWCHQSGLINPIIPPSLVEISHRFVLTSPCSLAANGIAGSRALAERSVSVISSGAGCEELPLPPERCVDTPLRTGYLGSLNFAKLHPDYVDWLAAVELPNFQVRMVGDMLNQEVLKWQAKTRGKKNLLTFSGYAENVASLLANWDVLAYLLNPRHYGTAENALLEAMAMGVVPVVLNNPAEQAIVCHGETGMVVSSREEFAATMHYLASHPEERTAMGRRAVTMARTNYTITRLGVSFAGAYREVLAREKRVMEFSNIFGNSPAEWFLSCQGDHFWFNDSTGCISETHAEIPHDLLEQTKGSVFHFQDLFPSDRFLKDWASNLELISKARLHSDE
jgi:glycosyltransferase involved in cell wall biosynthesis